MTFLSRILFVVAMLWGQSSVAQTAIEREFETFVCWFGGSWDNGIQAFNQSFAGTPEGERHKRTHMEYEVVRNESVPGVLFVIKNYGAGRLWN